MSQIHKVLAEEGHFVNILPPIDITGGVTAQIFSMENYAHASIIIQAGVTALAWTKIIVNECNTIGGGAANPIAFNIYKEETALGDTLGDRTAVALAGLTPSANDNIFYAIELDAAELADGFHFVQLSLTNGANANLVSAIAILTGVRYAAQPNLTAIL